MANGRGMDRRVKKTQRLLHGALASLIHEKSYDNIVVKEILARADVGRSTFYTHFRDKDELLESGIRDVLRTNERTSPTRSMDSADRILRFSLTLFEHIERYRGTSDSSSDAKRQSVVHEHLQRVLVDFIAEELKRTREDRHDVPCDLLAQHVASTFLVVLNWWLGSQEPMPARKVNELYRALVLPILAASPAAL